MPQTLECLSANEQLSMKGCHTNMVLEYHANLLNIGDFGLQILHCMPPHTSHISPTRFMDIMGSNIHLGGDIYLAENLAAPVLEELGAIPEPPHDVGIIWRKRVLDEQVWLS